MYASRHISHRVGLVMAGLGAALVIVSSLAGGDLSSGLIVFVVWALVPYAVLAIASRFVGDLWIVGGAGAAALAAEVGIRLSVFVFPRGSTAGLALVFSPAVISIVFLPIGALGGYAVGRAVHSRRVWLQIPSLILTTVALGLVTLQFARPDLFLTAVYERRRVLARLGLPGVVVGDEAFERILVVSQSSWRQTGDFDGAAGDEIARIDYRGIEFLDGSTFAPRGRAELSGEAQRWNWPSRLIRSEGRLVIAETGGGYQETLLRGLDGRVLWRYHPHPTLPPSALLPADLDGDGEPEFYAATTDSIVRLDAAGREVWRQAERMPGLIALEPRSSTSSAWIVSVDQGRRTTVRDDTGRTLAQIQTGDAFPIGIVDWPAARVLVMGGSTMRGIALNGTTKFEWSIDDATTIQVMTVRFGPGELPRLAIVAAAPRDTHRWRLQLLSPDLKIEYDEVLATSARLLKARRADGGETLLLNGDRLEALKPRR